MSQTDKNDNKNDDDNNNAKRSSDSVESPQDKSEKKEVGNKEDDDDEDQEKGDDEGIDDEAAKEYKPYESHRIFPLITKTIWHANKSDNKDDIDEDDDNYGGKGSWDSLESLHDKWEEHVEDEEEDDDDEDQEEGDDEGIDDEAAKKYKPYRNRHILSPVTKMEARIHLLNGSLSLGTVVLPTALKSFGVLYGLFGVIVIGAIANHCLHLLIKSMYRMYCRLHVPCLSYSECMSSAIQQYFGLSSQHTPAIAWFVSFLLFLCQLSIASTYVKYIAQALLENLGDLWRYYDISEDTIKAAVAIPLLLVNLLPTVKDLVYGSVIGLVTSIIAIGLVLVDKSAHFANVHVDESIRIIEYPYFVGVALFSTYILGTVLLLERNMRCPKMLMGRRGIMNQIMFVIVVIYLVYGFMGAVTLRSIRHKRMLLDDIKRLPIEFTINAKFFLIVASFFAHPLVCYEMFEIVWSSHLNRYVQHSFRLRQGVINYTVRATIVFITVGLACLQTDIIPALVSLFGSLLISVVGIILPSLLHILASHKLRRWIICKDLLLIFFGCSTFVAGIYILVNALHQWMGYELR